MSQLEAIAAQAGRRDGFTHRLQGNPFQFGLHVEEDVLEVGPVPPAFRPEKAFYENSL